MPRYKLTLEYNGLYFQGWQRQKEGNGVQNLLEKAVQAFCGSPQEVVGAGRTDAGVHGLGQVAHVDLPRPYPLYSIMQGLNAHIRALSPRRMARVAIYHVEEVPSDFHARFSAIQRGYVYKIVNRQAPLALERGMAWQYPWPLEALLMEEGAQYLKGHHDFTSFRGADCQSASPCKTLDFLHVTRVGDQVIIRVEARSFLYHQVRNIVGTLVLVGSGKKPPSFVGEVLAQKDRKKAGPTASPEGLYLSFVKYEKM